MAQILDSNFFQQGTPPKPEGIPKWWTENYNGMEADIAQDIYASTYWSIRESYKRRAEEDNTKFDPDNDTALNNQIRADAVNQATVHLDEMVDGTQRAHYQLLYIISRDNLYRMTPQEYDSVDEFLLDRIPRLSSTSGEFYDIKFIYDQLFPMLNRIQNGWKPENLIALKNHWSKTRASIPYMRSLVKKIIDAERVYDEKIEKRNKKIRKHREKIRTATSAKDVSTHRNEIDGLKTEIEELTTEKEEVVLHASHEFKEGIDKALKAIADPNVSAYDDETGIKKVLQPDYNMEMYQGYQLSMEKETVFVLKVPVRYERTVEKMLKGIARFGVYTESGLDKDEQKMLKHLETNLYPKEKEDENSGNGTGSQE